MTKSHVSTKYEITVHDLLHEERKIKNLFFKQRLMSVRLVMRGTRSKKKLQVMGYFYFCFIRFFRSGRKFSKFTF